MIKAHLLGFPSIWPKKNYLIRFLSLFLFLFSPEKTSKHKVHLVLINQFCHMQDELWGKKKQVCLRFGFWFWFCFLLVFESVLLKLLYWLCQAIFCLQFCSSNIWFLIHIENCIIVFSLYTFHFWFSDFFCRSGLMIFSWISLSLLMQKFLIFHAWDYAFAWEHNNFQSFICKNFNNVLQIAIGLPDILIVLLCTLSNKFSDMLTKKWRKLEYVTYASIFYCSYLTFVGEGCQILRKSSQTNYEICYMIFFLSKNRGPII